MRWTAHATRVLAATAVVLGLSGDAGAIQDEKRYQDATPSGVPPGYEPVDVSEDMPRIESRNQREMERAVDREMEARYTTPERRIRARYGGATWNLYDPYH